MSFLIKKHVLVFSVVIFIVMIPTHALFAKVSSKDPSIILVPNAQNQKAQEQLVANLLAQKFFLSLKKNEEYQTRYNISFTFTPPLKNENAPALAGHYVEQNYTNVIVINTQYLGRNQAYKVTIDFFYHDKKMKSLHSISFTTTFDAVLSAFSIFDVLNTRNSDAITQRLSQILEILSKMHKRSVIFISHEAKNGENAKPYFVRLNRVMLEEPSPTKIVIREKKNFIEILEISQDDTEKPVRLGAFVASPILDEYNVIISPPNGDEAQSTISSPNATFLNSMITSNFLLGYSYLALSSESFGSSHFLSGSMRVAFSPQVPFLALGLETPFIIPVSRESEKTYSFLGFSAFVSGVFPIAKNTEFIVRGGGGFVSASTLTIPKTIKKIKNDTQVQGQANGGLGFAYNIPIKESGYIRIIFDLGITWFPLKNVGAIDDNNNNARIRRSTQRVQRVTSLLFVNTLFGIGIRF